MFLCSPDVRSSFFVLLLGAIFLFPPAPAEARQTVDLRPANPDRFAFFFEGGYRIQGTGIPTDFAVDAEGTTLGQAFALDQRFRVGIGLRARAVELRTEWDLFTGQLAGDTWDIPGQADVRLRHMYAARTLQGFIPRRASVSVRSPVISLEGGLMLANWGLGLLANDGTRESLFGRTDFGDRLLGARITLQPFGGRPDHPLSQSLYVVLQGANIVADDGARWADNQSAYQATAAVLYRTELGASTGLMFTYRSQREELGERTTQLAIVDAYAAGAIPLGGAGWKLALGIEGAGQFGYTNRSLSYNSREGLRITAAGAAGYAILHAPQDRVRVHLLGGVASGDPNPEDDQSNDFRFDRDFNVGLVLFDELTGAVEAASHAQLIDPENAGQPPEGIDTLVTEGAIQRTVYVQPALQFLPTQGRAGPDIDLRVGVLLAGSTVPFRQPFYSYRAGGAAYNHHGVPTSGNFLGAELDWAFRIGGKLGRQLDEPLYAQLAVQGGHLLRGPALGAGDQASGTSDPMVIHKILATARIQW